MPSADVSWPVPLIRTNPWSPGQMGVPGTDTETGLRSHSTGAIFYVDPNAVGVSDRRDGTNPTDPLATIAAALTKCQPYRGDTIAVMANNAWQYGRAADGYNLPISEEVSVTVPGVRIVGVNPSSPNGVIWTPASNGGLCIDVLALDVLIEGFVFSEGAFTGCDAIRALWASPTAFGDNMVVRHCSFDDTVDKALIMEFAWYCDIHHNTFWECDEHGIYVDPAGSGIDFSTIHDNIFHDCAVAMALRGSDNAQIFRNSIFNTLAQSGAAATDQGIDTTGGLANQVFDNYFSCLLPVGVGDWNDLNTAAATDAWINNHCMNGLAITNPT